MLQRREAAGFAVALLAHAAAFLAVALQPLHGPPVDATPPLALDIEVEPDHPAPEPSATAETPDSLRAPEPPHPERSTGPAVEARRDLASERSPSEPNAPVEPAPSGSGTPFTFNPTSPSLSNDALGLGGRNRFIGTGPERPSGGGAEEAPANMAPGVDQSMHDALEARDHALGLDQAGPMVAVLEEVTRPSDTPMDGYAVFEVTVDSNGQVSDVRVVDSNQSRPSWERVAMELKTTLRSRGIALRRKVDRTRQPDGGGKGEVVVTLEVKSRWSLPSGGGAAAITDPYAKLGVDPASPIGVGGHFDLSDIGQRPSRQVHARIIGERKF